MRSVRASRCSNSARWTAFLSARAMLRAPPTVAVLRVALGGLAVQAVVPVVALLTISRAGRAARRALVSQKASRAFPEVELNRGNG